MLYKRIHQYWSPASLDKNGLGRSFLFLLRASSISPEWHYSNIFTKQRKVEIDRKHNTHLNFFWEYFKMYL